MAVDPKRIVEVERTYIGTPWHHAARLKGVGIDCAGLLVCVSHELGIPVEDFVNYDREDEFESLVGEIEKYCNQIPISELAKTGDILVFRSRQMYNHCGFFSEERRTFIHAYNTPGCAKVVETPFDTPWVIRLARIYRYKDLEQV